MKSLVLLATLVIVCMTTASAIPVNTFKIPGRLGQERNFTLVGPGPVESKLFYKEHSEVTWFEADEICRENGMQLAELTSEKQVQFLADNWAIEFSGDHWIAARDSQEVRQFAWNSLGLQPSELVIDFGGVEIPYQLCLSFWSLTFLSQTMGEYCTEKFNPLCEIQVNETYIHSAEI